MTTYRKRRGSKGEKAFPIKQNTTKETSAWCSKCCDITRQKETGEKYKGIPVTKCVTCGCENVYTTYFVW